MKRYLNALVLSFCLLLVTFNAYSVTLTLPDLDGRDRTLSEFRGKWVLVNFWATWCPPCIEEMSTLELFYNAHKDRDAVVVGVNMEDIGVKKLRAFVDEMFISYPILLAPSDGETALGRITALPTSILISPQGEVVDRHVGGMTARMLGQFIQRNIRPKRPAGSINEK